MKILAPLLGVAAFAALLLRVGCGAAPATPEGFVVREHPKTGRFIIYGDTRPPAPFESMLRESDFKRERWLIADAIAAQSPDLVIHSGDVIAHASSDSQWAEEWDPLTASWRDAGFPVYLAYGNHEYWFDAADAARNIAKRFPWQRGRHWFSVKYGKLEILVVDSNFTQLAPDEVARQEEWLGRRLAEQAADAAIEHVFVVCHHAPYTNTRIHVPDTAVQERFVARWRGHPKVRAVFSGHVHNYERFRFDGVHYLVSGGGGAPRTAVDVKTPTYEDHFSGPAIRPFHFCIVTVEEKQIRIDVVMLGEKGEWRIGDSFVIQ